ncbi:MAG: hypothetical protein COV52_01620 [Gammaproteobacteria bacterium CG11_big_fil_rev_8_21_14_0_20_46_22]|nr:MAG: hypothetical protein COW05_05515 [Gammaproteobacteria bacterium CG12_big_fil_rev_8_21_14_0_65_46_12]PIR11813.1 MAG: hypothetical protein COV52_01620 [Gammaproteobacteria bacterium CG11_big_fil_rev_8_21_14_0_20_46_22]
MKQKQSPFLPTKPAPQTWREKTLDWLVCYLTCDVEPTPSVPLSNFDQVQQKLKPGDVLLVEGRSRVSRVISTITKSAWTHAALYLGCLRDCPLEFITLIKPYYDGAEDIPLVIESRLEAGVIILPLAQYRNEHVRICRAQSLEQGDIHQVIHYTLSRVGLAYDHQHIFDLARFLFPWFLLPRRWRSSLFRYQAGDSAKITCSLLIAEAFMSIRYPILPVVRERSNHEGYEFIRRNPRLFTPRDFDYSPYFSVIKCPVVEFCKTTPYTTIPWNEDWISHDGEGITPIKQTKKAENTDDITKRSR